MAISQTIKEHNLDLIVDYLYSHASATKQTLERKLGLSLPTITKNLRTLEIQGLIEQGELMESTGGRKAQSYRFRPSSHLAIGVAMGKRRATICTVDLHGVTIDKEQVNRVYSNDDAYFIHLGKAITAIAERMESQGSKVLGVAFAVQGLLSSDGSSINFGKIMDNTGLSLARINQGLNLPSMLIHDSDASAMAELWFDPSIQNAVCIYLEDRPGGAIIVDGKLYQGPNLRNGTIEHMRLIPGGRRCYCGQLGCMDTYCSSRCLTGEKGDLRRFFQLLRQGDTTTGQCFDEWMGHLADTVVNVRSVLSTDVIIGGRVTRYLNDEDMNRLGTLVDTFSSFDAPKSALRRSICQPDQNIVGAALRYVGPFVNLIRGKEDVRKTEAVTT